MVIRLMITVNFYMNTFVWRKGISQILPPLTIVKGLVPDANKHFHVLYGEYCNTYEGTTNTMELRTVGALALGPTGNTQGGVRCYSLRTGNILNRMMKDIIIAKMPEEALGRLKYITKKEKSVKGLTFGCRNNDDDDDDTTGVLDGETDNENTDDHINPPNTLEADNNGERQANHFEVPDEAVLQDDDDENDETQEDDSEDDSSFTGVFPANAKDEFQPEDLEKLEEMDSDSDDEEDKSEEYVTRYGRTIKPPADWTDDFPEVYGSTNFAEDVTVIELDTPDIDVNISACDEEEYALYVEALEWFEFDQDEITSMVFKAKQMNMQQGIKKFGSDGKKSAMKEIENLTGNECFGEIEYEDLTDEMKDKALPILMFMIMKRNGNIKTRGVANGSFQRVYTDKDDCSSPTPDFYAFKYMVATIAKEGRDCATVDLPGFFLLQTEQDENVTLILKLTGAVALLLVESDEAKWRRHLKQENGKWVLYVRCDKAIYGTMNAALLAYKKLAKLFTEWGFVMNPYDPCVWNKMVGNHQMSIMFHIDDLLMAHNKSHIVTLFIKKLEQAYAKRDPLTVTQGLVHEYLGMTIDFRRKYQVALSQYDFVKKLNNDLPDDMKTGRYQNSPGPEDLFKVNNESPELDAARKEEYHKVTAKTLWLSQRSRPDIQLATGYHCTHVKFPNEQDYYNMTWLQRYIWLTRFLPTVIEITEDGAIIYIDGSHAVHADAKGHSGMFTTMGRGAIMNVARKLGLNTVSSTETEVVSSGERMPKCTWFRYFRLAQGDKPIEDVLMQDNKSAILLQKNWPFSTGKGSKHIHVRYFFVVDKIKNKEVRIIHLSYRRDDCGFQYQTTTR